METRRGREQGEGNLKKRDFEASFVNRSISLSI